MPQMFRLDRAYLSRSLLSLIGAFPLVAGASSAFGSEASDVPISHAKTIQSWTAEQIETETKWQLSGVGLKQCPGANDNPEVKVGYHDNDAVIFSFCNGMDYALLYLSQHRRVRITPCEDFKKNGGISCRAALVRLQQGGTIYGEMTSSMSRVTYKALIGGIIGMVLALLIWGLGAAWKLMKKALGKHKQDS